MTLIYIIYLNKLIIQLRKVKAILNIRRQAVMV